MRNRTILQIGPALADSVQGQFLALLLESSRCCYQRGYGENQTPYGNSIMSQELQSLFRKLHRAVAAANTAHDAHVASGESHATRANWIAAIKKLVSAASKDSRETRTHAGFY